MRLKLYRAAEIMSAMELVRRDLGVEALILSTRKTAHGVEVTAALEPPPLTVGPLPDPAVERALAYHGVPTKFTLPLMGAPLPERLEATISFASLPISHGERPLLFTGPPGAGKTLTVVRLATRLVMRGVAPMVITADTSRAGAAEQLATFTRLLGLDLVVANHPVALGRALARRIAGAPVLIDLPGTSPFDADQQAELGALAAVSNGSMALVLPAGTDAQEASETASAYAESGAKYLIITRLDVARRIGCIVSAASSGLALAEVGIGPQAAGGLIPATAGPIAARLLDVPPNWERCT